MYVIKDVHLSLHIQVKHLYYTKKTHNMTILS